MEIRYAENQASFTLKNEKGSSVLVITKLVEGNYPNYRQVIPSETKERVSLSREELMHALRRADRAMIVITHYQRLLNYIVPDFVHVLFGGRIVKSGTKELALELERKGYDWVKAEAAAH